MALVLAPHAKANSTAPTARLTSSSTKVKPSGDGTKALLGRGIIEGKFMKRMAGCREGPDFDG